MTDQDSSYRPRSPDLSSLPPVASPYTPSPYPLTSPLAHRASYDASPFFSPQYQQQQYVPPPSFAPYSSPAAPSPGDMARRSTRVSRAAETVAAEPPVVQSKPEDPSPVTEAPRPRPGAGIEVKTKFPVARIKRIMQADEDVGKVAQVTPIAVSKALELFMISLVTKAAQEARERNSKRITAAHLKQAVAKDEVLDFLADIIAKVPDQPAGKKHDDDGSDHNEGGGRRRQGRRRKEESD
ncbi:putative histone-like transcription factor (CBF/NF-Y) [Thermoascus aurantiacus ATCC 26904]